MKNQLKFVLAAALFGGMTSVAMAQGDAANGEKVFRKCQACHMVGENAKNRVGPVLNNVIGRQAGTIEGFRYSNINQAAGEAGLVWSEDLIFEYLPDPNGFLKKYLTDAGQADKAKGATRMAFRLRDEQERRDVIAYIAQFSPEQTETEADAEQPATQ